jgi:hypothetical protein
LSVLLLLLSVLLLLLLPVLLLSFRSAAEESAFVPTAAPLRQQLHARHPERSEGLSMTPLPLLFPEMKPSLKIKFKNVAHFSSLKIRCFPTTFHQHFTTFSPPKHHVMYPNFPKTPLKNPAKQRNPDSHRGSTFFPQNIAKTIAKQTVTEQVPRAAAQPVR